MNIEERIMIELLIIIICLYIVYQFVGKYLLPRISEYRLAKYKKQFFEENTHIDKEKYSQLKQEQEDNAPIIDKRKSFRI